VPDENTEKLNELFNSLSKALKKDEHADIVGDDIHLRSFVPYGIRSLPCIDIALGRPGIPVGKVVELYGWEGCGKTTLALHLVAIVQQMGGAALWIDAENALDEYRAAQIGVNTQKPHFITAECETIEGIIRTQEKTLDNLQEINYTKPFIIVTDSVTAVSTEAALRDDFKDEQRPGHEAKQIRAGLKRLCYRLAECKVPSVFINHNVAKITRFPGSDRVSAGGHGIKFWAAVRIELAKVMDLRKKVMGDSVRYGQRVKFTVQKNKVGELARQSFECNLRNDIGFDVEDNLLDACRWAGMVTRPASAKDTEASTIYTFTIGEETTKFKRDEWPGIVQDLGGMEKVWDLMADRASYEGILKPYGVEL